MTLFNNLLFFFSALGAFNGLLIGTYFLFFARRRNLSAYCLGGLLLALSIRIAKSVAYFFDYSVSKSVLQLGLSACLFIGPFLFFFVKTELSQTAKMPVSWKRQLMVWSSLILVAALFFSYEQYPSVWTNYLIAGIYLQWGVYLSLTLIQLKPLIRKLPRKQDLKPFEKWLLTISAMVLTIFLAYVWAYTGLTRGSYITGPLNFSLSCYLIIFILLYRRKANDLSSFSGQKYGDRKLDETEVTTMLARLEALMTEKKLYRNPNLKISELAEYLNIPAYQVSRLLNDFLQKNFSGYVNEFRVNAACELLRNSSPYTIEAIGEEVGFHSKSTFFTAFKKVKGLTPNAYRKETGMDS